MDKEKSYQLNRDEFQISQMDSFRLLCLSRAHKAKQQFDYHMARDGQKYAPDHLALMPDELKKRLDFWQDIFTLYQATALQAASFLDKWEK